MNVLVTDVAAHLAFATLLVSVPMISFARATTTRTLVAVLAHADDEGPAAPMLARYAREGAQVNLLIATDGGQGTGFALARGETAPPQGELARARTEEARCAAAALSCGNGADLEWSHPAHSRVPDRPSQ
jgi:LmbE family N-acetylglucosaminyl deacetylase